MKVEFRERLEKRQKEINSLLCVGLDPLLSKIPQCLLSEYDTQIQALTKQMIDIVFETESLALAFKLQSASFESIRGGRDVMQKLIKIIRELNVPVIVDCKRGEIKKSQERYGVAHFELDGADAITFNPYLGSFCLTALVDVGGIDKGCIGLCYTSDPGSREVQDIICYDGRPYWQHMAEKILQWSHNIESKNVGIVMAAAHKKVQKELTYIFYKHLIEARKIVEDKLWFLIPGIGEQEGIVKETIESAYCGAGSIAVNSSSGIIFAGSDSDYAQAAANKAEELRDEMRKYM